MKLRKEVKRMKDLENICLSVEHDFDGKYQSVAPEIVQTSSFQFQNFYQILLKLKLENHQ